MNLADYVITPVDVWNWCRSLGRWRSLTSVMGLVGAIVALMLGISTALVGTLFLLLALWVLGVDARVPFVAAIGLLIAIALLSALDVSQASDKNSVQNTLAVYAYYCLVIGVLLLIRDQVMPEQSTAQFHTTRHHSAQTAQHIHAKRAHHRSGARALLPAASRLAQAHHPGRSFKNSQNITHGTANEGIQMSMTAHEHESSQGFNTNQQVAKLKPAHHPHLQRMHHRSNGAYSISSDIQHSVNNPTNALKQSGQSPSIVNGSAAPPDANRSTMLARPVVSHPQTSSHTPHMTHKLAPNFRRNRDARLMDIAPVNNNATSNAVSRQRPDQAIHRSVAYPQNIAHSTRAKRLYGRTIQ